MDKTVTWEYCMVWDNSTNYWIDDKENDVTGIESDITINYTSGDLVQTVYLTSPRDNKDRLLWPRRPINDAIGMLGAFGWELVQVYEYSNLNKYYFKRIKKAGRSVTEPKLVLAIEPVRQKEYYQ